MGGPEQTGVCFCVPAVGRREGEACRGALGKKAWHPPRTQEGQAEKAQGTRLSIHTAKTEPGLKLGSPPPSLLVIAPCCRVVLGSLCVCSHRGRGSSSHFSLLHAHMPTHHLKNLLFLKFIFSPIGRWQSG